MRSTVSIIFTQILSVSTWSKKYCHTITLSTEAEGVSIQINHPIYEQPQTDQVLSPWKKSVIASDTDSGGNV
jgi:hypothetical protein